jgi:hypothetical protein
MMASAPCVVIVAVVANGNVVVMGEIIDWSRVPLPLLFVLFLFLFLLLNEDENTDDDDDDDENDGDEDDAKIDVVLLVLLSMTILLFLSCRCPSSSNPLLVQGSEAAMRETFLSYLFLLFCCRCAVVAKLFVVIQRVPDVVVVVVAIILIVSVSVSVSVSSSSSVSATVLDTYSFRVCACECFIDFSFLFFFSFFFPFFRALLSLFFLMLLEYSSLSASKKVELLCTHNKKPRKETFVTHKRGD